MIEFKPDYDQSPQSIANVPGKTFIYGEIRMIRFRFANPLQFGLLIAAGVALTAAGTLAAAAPPSPKAAIAARQANYKKIGSAMKAINDEMKNGGSNKAAMTTAAKTIAAMSRAQMPLFPNGSGASAGVKTDALPAIWRDRGTFDAQLKKLVAESDKLVAATGTGNVAAISAQYKVVGATCKACHTKFRADD